ncbi:indolepyruvate oxidoreductase subunit beta family protein [Roseibium aggregatum]|uniref:indolepyruvate oxidoreductase subunit beta family protein n=1 Tax=Roseibium aggregatum TaxID=187304 RepID=UPI000315F483|nr:indolepyruvate oxidoreductase subunit beta family protein [Roseibium aggregatum]
MSLSLPLDARPADPALEGIIKLAILAVGGQGGGVLTNWIESLARSQGYHCQATSVAGVAQRTGATIYYMEMAPGDVDAPVFSLAPSAGDVDIIIAAEMMEAGRAIIRGFVTPDRTTLIASSHRMLAVSEKTVPGDGMASSEEVKAAAELAAQKLVLADMDTAALKVGSVISASLFGALAGSGALPFEREAFEEAIRAGGKGVEASLRAFAAGYDLAKNGEEPKAEAVKPAHQEIVRPAGPDMAQKAWASLEAKVAALPEPVREMARAGLRKVVDFQDTDYGAEYLSRLEGLVSRDSAEKDYELSREAAKYIANAMAYDDVIRVADLKTRPQRFNRIETEMKVKDGKLLHLTDYLHPRAEEIVGLLPEKMGRKMESDPAWMKRIDRWFNRGRRIRTDSLRGFAMLYFLGGLRGWRRRTLRHRMEQEHLESWLKMVSGYLPDRYAMAVEVLKCRRLIKGYSDTHARGLSKFDKVLAGARLVESRDDGPEWVARLREAALKDEKGTDLDGALKTVESFV